MKSMKMMHGAQRGFTLIELVMVIVILGILAAVALPKFINLGTDARTAAMKAVDGSMRSANVMIYAKAAVANQLGGTALVPVDVTVNGVAISTVFGFAEDSAELAKAMDLSADFDAATAPIVSHTGAADSANCKVTYGAAASAAVAPTFTLVTSGC